MISKNFVYLLFNLLYAELKIKKCNSHLQAIVPFRVLLIPQKFSFCKYQIFFVNNVWKSQYVKSADKKV